MKLFLVKCKGMQSSVSGSPHGLAYVLAEDPTDAYNKLRKKLDEMDLGFPNDRTLASVTLLADDAVYPEADMQLLV